MDAGAMHQLESYYPEFRDVMAGQGKPLPFHVQQEFANYFSSRMMSTPKSNAAKHGFSAPKRRISRNWLNLCIRSASGFLESAEEEDLQRETHY